MKTREPIPKLISKQQCALESYDIVAGLYFKSRTCGDSHYKKALSKISTALYANMRSRHFRMPPANLLKDLLKAEVERGHLSAEEAEDAANSSMSIENMLQMVP